MYSWVVQLLHEAGSKDFIVTSIAAFSALCLVVGLGQGLVFLDNPYVQLWRDLHSSFMPPLGCVTITGLFQRNSADLQQVCCPSLLISHCLALMAVLLHTNSSGFRRNYVIQPLAGM